MTTLLFKFLPLKMNWSLFFSTYIRLGGPMLTSLLLKAIREFIKNSELEIQ